MENENTQPQTTPGSKKTLWYIIGAVIVLLLGSNFVWGFFARNATERMIENATGGDVDINSDGTMTYESEQGKAVIGQNKLPDNWPSDAPKYPNGNIQFSASSNMQDGTPGLAATFTTKDSATEVVSFYKRELTSNGWKSEGEANMGGITVLSYKKSNRVFAVQISDPGSGDTQVTVGVSQNN